MDSAESEDHDIGKRAADELIRNRTRITTPDGIDDQRTVSLGGLPAAVYVRGHNRNNPILLFAHGGPGTPLSGTSWMWQQPFEEFFTVIHYDQRGAGRSHHLAKTAGSQISFDLDRYVEDLCELSADIRDEFGMRPVLIGHSWGTVVATLAAHWHPNLFSAYVGIGQVVDFRASEREAQHIARARAHATADETALAGLDALEPYPPKTMSLEVLATQRHWVTRLGGFAAGRSDCDYFIQPSAISPTWNRSDHDGGAEGNIATLTGLLAELQDVDLNPIEQIHVPVLQILGRHDGMTPPTSVATWMSRLRSPRTQITWFENSAHMAMFEEPGRLLMTLKSFLACPAEDVDPSTPPT